MIREDRDLLISGQCVHISFARNSDVLTLLLQFLTRNCIGVSVCVHRAVEEVSMSNHMHVVAVLG
jgi:hypothetical protein